MTEYPSPATAVAALVTTDGSATLSPIAEHYSRIWCRSFGVEDETAIDRLKKKLLPVATTTLSSGGQLDEVEARLDAVAESDIRLWFARLMGRPVDPTPQALAIVRLAFLDVNGEGAWSSHFLAEGTEVEALKDLLEGAMFEPTPTLVPRQMARQNI